MEAVIYGMIFLPFLAAGFLPLAKKNQKIESRIVTAVSVLVCILAVILRFLPDMKTGLSVFGNMGLHFSHDGSLPTILVILAAFMWLAESLFAPEYFKGAENNSRFYTFYLLTQGALFGVFLSADLFTLFVFFEIMSLSSYVWIAQTETTDAIAVSKTYLYFSLIGGMVMLMGVFLLYHRCGSVNWDVIARTDLTDTVRYVSGGCLLFGFGIKAGIFPLHIWLPVAHPVAPAPASALLSGILLKSGIFGILLTTKSLFPADLLWGNILLVLAVITMLLGGILGIFSTDLKRTLACSSMSQIGFILFGIACVSLLGEEITVPSAGATLHLANHALIKLVLFTISGIVYKNLHSITYNRIRGFGKGKPGLMIPFLFCACSISGIPGFSGYISKTLLHEGLVEFYTHAALDGQSIVFYKGMEALFLVSGACTLAYMLKLFYVLFIARSPAEEAAARNPEAAAKHPASSKHTAGKPPTKKKPYTRPVTLVVLFVPAVIMPLFGILAWQTMEKVFRLAAEFFEASPRIMVEYFSYECIKGALISILIGILIFVFNIILIRGRRTDGRDNYLNRWSRRLNLEYQIYRPLLKLLALIGTVIARSLETASTFVCYGIINLIFFRAEKKVVPPKDSYFGKYGKEIVRHIADESFSSDLLLALLGITAILLFVLIRVIVS